ncbi:MAG: hypothetical protein DI529_09905 [Chryseobacterium sp.]|nr:MAG: hypothetical protein DI529_09905 [Chryseobacterium sp.]
MKNNNISENQDIDLLMLHVLTELLEILRSLKRPNTSETEYLDSSDVKRLLNISDSTLNRMRKQKKIPFIRFGYKIFYPKSFFINAMQQKNNMI